jgi:hypothetical protein
MNKVLLIFFLIYIDKSIQLNETSFHKEDEEAIWLSSCKVQLSKSNQIIDLTSLDQPGTPRFLRFLNRNKKIITQKIKF